jgi:hypothetical protein
VKLILLRLLLLFRSINYSTYCGFSLTIASASSLHRVMQSIDTVLQLSQIFGMQTSEAGAIVVEFIFAIVWQLLDASLDDEGLLANTPEKKPRWVTNPYDMEIGRHDNYDEKQTEHHERMQKFNTVMAIELIGQFLQNKVTSGILNLARQNMYMLSSLSNWFFTLDLLLFGYFVRVKAD